MISFFVLVGLCHLEHSVFEPPRSRLRRPSCCARPREPSADRQRPCEARFAEGEAGRLIGVADEGGAASTRVRANKEHDSLRIVFRGLHGLYTFATEDKLPRLEVWMRTRANEQVVKFRTFLRTVCHELLHHLDVTVFALDDSFHTEGFFRRESSLVRALLGEEKRPRRAERPAVQMGLFDTASKPPGPVRDS